MKIFNYAIKFIITDERPIQKVKKIITDRVGRKFEGVAGKINAIKVLREAEVVKLLIDANLVPEDAIISHPSGGKSVSLVYAKEWAEHYLFGVATYNYKFE